MADVNHVISFGIGTPASIPHFLLMGLTPEGTAPIAPTADWSVLCAADDVTVFAEPDDLVVVIPSDDSSTVM